MNPKLHVSLEVNDLEQSVRFYSTLFNIAPTKTKPGYAKFDVGEPGVVLSLTQPTKAPCCVSGLSHLGVRVESTEQVLAARDRLQKAGLATLDEINTTVIAGKFTSSKAIRRRSTTPHTWRRWRRAGAPAATSRRRRQRLRAARECGAHATGSGGASVTVRFRASLGMTPSAFGVTSIPPRTGPSAAAIRISCRRS